MSATWCPAARLAEIVGEEAAAILLREKASRPLYVRARAPHPDLVELIGAGPAAALSATYGGQDIILPTSAIRPEPRKVRVAELLEAGASIRDVAAEVGVSARFVGEVKRDLGLSRPRRKPKVGREVIEAMVRAGRMDAEIAQSLGVPQKRVWCVRQEIQREARA
ncbi:hypothetical protein [Desulfomicrobium escambiense]|uniref:hypothetical protein n=1 Tax=Desulfomicrobium escambiense TaxID=29503 RepID=UPI00041A052E|nr:hypothetical protein [Desulfomicrobium escambiense]